MAHRVARVSFEKFAKARIDFATEMLDLASKPFYIDALQDEGAVLQLKPLISDTSPTVCEMAANALAKIASYTPELAEEVAVLDILPTIVEGLKKGTPSFRKAGVTALRSVAKHSAQLAACVVEAGAPDVLAVLLEELDAVVREATAAAIAAIASHSAELGNTMVDAGMVSLLVVCVQEPEVSLKRACISALASISSFAPDLAEVVAGSGAVPHLVASLRHSDARLKRQACHCLSQIAKHTVELAEVVVEAGAFPIIFACLQDVDVFVRKNAAAACRDVVRHSEEVASIVVKGGGSAALVEYVNEAEGGDRLPGVVALGHIASFSETLSSDTLSAGAANALKRVLVDEPEDHMKAAAVWALGQCGKHDAEHANALAEGDVLRHVLAAMIHEESSEDLRTKAKRALKAVGGQCTHLGAMQGLLHSAPVSVLRVLLGQFAKVVPEDADERRQLVASGGLKVIQGIDPAVHPEVAACIDTINAAYPAEVVEYCSPDFSATLADRITT